MGPSGPRARGRRRELVGGAEMAELPPLETSTLSGGLLGVGSLPGLAHKDSKYGSSAAWWYPCESPLKEGSGRADLHEQPPAGTGVDHLGGHDVGRWYG